MATLAKQETFVTNVKIFNIGDYDQEAHNDKQQ